MPPKAKKGGKKKGKATKGKSSGPLDNYDYSSILSTVEDSFLVNHVLVTIRLSLQWSYLNFSMYLPITTSFEVVKHRIIARHRNALSSIRIFLHSPDPKNRITDELLTFADLGVEGLPYKAEPPVKIDLYYDFEASALALDQLSFNEELYQVIGDQVISMEKGLIAHLLLRKLKTWMRMSLIYRN
ncbi:hypothetical protein GEMRC1_010552 [Eukaryota sp. GEM-RC1]